MASRSWNRVELIGNLTRDPELRYTPNGAAVCTIGIATNRTYVLEGERKEEVDFHRIVAWNKLAELCNQLLKKGSKVFISGRLQYHEWEPQEGGKRRDAEIVLEDMVLLSPKEGGYAREEVSEGTRENNSEEKHETAAAPAKTEEPEKIEEPKEDKAESKPAENETVSADDLPF